MPRHSAKIEVGDLVELRSGHKLQKFYKIWRSTGIVTDIYVSEKKGLNCGKEMAKIYFSHKVVWSNGAFQSLPYNKEVKILLKRMKKVRS